MSASSLARPDAAPFGFDPAPDATSVPTEIAFDAPFGLEDASGAEGTTRIVVLGGRDAARGVDAGAVRPGRGGPAHPLSPVSLLDADQPKPTGRRPMPRLHLGGASRAAKGGVAGAAAITMPRAAALIVAGLVAGVATTALMLLGRPELEYVSAVQVLLPLALAGAAVGVGRLFDWAPLAWSEWRGPLGYATAAPWALAMLVAAAAPTLALPYWLPAILGLLAAAPFLWSAVGPRRLRGRVRPNPEPFGRRGGLMAAGVLAMVTYSGVRPDLGGLLPTVLFFGLVVVAFSARGLADAGATWGVAAWAALAGGSVVVWASTLLAVLAPQLLPGWAHALVVALAALPLVVATLAEGRARP